MAFSSSLSAFGGLTNSFGTSAAVQGITASAGAVGALQAGLSAGASTSSFAASGFGAVGKALQAGGALTNANNIAAAAGAAAGQIGGKALSTGLAGFGIGTQLAGPGAASTDLVWNFIVAPEDISWDTAVATSRVDIFGTNAPPVIVGTKGMRDLTLSNAMIEGFTRARTVEGRVNALEKLMRFSLDGAKGFVNVPVYHVFANKKKYGDGNGEEGGYFVIKDIKIKETMRDLDGKSTRAFADISMVQVPKYQVNSGRDQASAAVNSAQGLLSRTAQTVAGQANNPSGSGSTAPATSGSSAPPPAPAPKPPTGGGGGGGGTPAQPAVTPIRF